MNYDKDRNRYDFAVKLSLGTLTCIAVILMIMLIYNYNVGNNIIADNIKDNSRNLATSSLNEINTYLSIAQQFSQDISNVLESWDINQEEIGLFLENSIKNCKEIYGCTIAFEPYIFDNSKRLFAPYFYKSSDKVKNSDLSANAHSYLNSDWYTIPKELNRGVWSEPHFDDNNVFLATYSLPFFKTINGKKTFCGIVACDIDLASLKKIIDNIKILNTGYAFILSSKGLFIEHINNDYMRLKNGIFSLAESRGDSNLKDLGQKMTNRKTGFTEYYSYTLGKEAFVFFAPIKETGWSIGIVIAEDEPFSDLFPVIWNLFTIGTIGYILILIIVVMAFSGFLWISFHVTDNSKHM